MSTETIKPVRVLLLTDSDSFAGTERHMLDLAAALRDRGHDVRLACPMPSPLADRAAGAGLAVVPVQKGGAVDAAAVRTLCRLLRSGAVEVIHAHNGRTALSAALAVTLARRGRCVLTQHFLAPSHAARRGVAGFVSRLAHGWVGGRAAHTIAISEAVRTAMLARREAPGAKITVVPNGIAAPDAVWETPRERVRAELGIGNEAPLIVCAARLEHEKDVETLVGAMARVAPTCPAAVCVVAGEGAQRPALERQVADLGLSRSVRLLGFRSDVPALMAAGDVFVLPSLAEPFGLVLVEAMALGLPVVATRTGGPLEIVVEAETGLLYPPGDADALARCLTALLADPVRARSLGDAGRMRMRERFTAEAMAGATEAVYARCLA